MEKSEITLRDAARTTGRPYVTLRSWYKKGLLRGRKSGMGKQDAILIETKSLEECLQAHPVKPKAPTAVAVAEKAISKPDNPISQPPTGSAVESPAKLESQQGKAPTGGGARKRRKKKISQRKRFIQRAKGAMRHLEPRDLIKLRNWTQERLDRGVVANAGAVVTNQSTSVSQCGNKE
jgi:hypothetical protein